MGHSVIYPDGMSVNFNDQAMSDFERFQFDPDWARKAEERRMNQILDRVGRDLSRYERMATRVVGKRRDGTPIFQMAGAADGKNYRDLRDPHITVDEASVSPTSAVALFPIARTITPANYFWVGKAVKITVFGKATTGATPGNFTWSLFYGSGNNTGVHADSVARAAIASVTNITWMLEGYMECRAIGTSGTCRMFGRVFADLALMLSTAQPNLIPGATPADATIDTTVNTNAFNPQLARSGSTAESAITTNLLFEALN